LPHIVVIIVIASVTAVVSAIGIELVGVGNKGAVIRIVNHSIPIAIMNRPSNVLH